jgi:hypothetical protein
MRAYNAVAYQSVTEVSAPTTTLAPRSINRAAMDGASGAGVSV